MGPNNLPGGWGPAPRTQVWELRRPTGGAGARRGWCDGCSRRHGGVDLVGVESGLAKEKVARRREALVE